MTVFRFAFPVGVSEEGSLVRTLPAEIYLTDGGYEGKFYPDRHWQEKPFALRSTYGSESLESVLDAMWSEVYGFALPMEEAYRCEICGRTDGLHDDEDCYK